MNAILKNLETRQIESLKGSDIPNFSPGDTVRVNIKIREGDRERVQAYEGVCIARKGREGDINANFTVRKISLGEGVERVFPLYSPRIDSIELIRRGDVRRAKLYYLRDRRGKSARISERTTGHGLDTGPQEGDELSKTQKTAQRKEAKQAAKAEARKAQDAARKAKEAAAKAEAEVSEDQAAGNEQ